MDSSSKSSSDSWLTEFRPLSRISWYSRGSAPGEARGQRSLSQPTASTPTTKSPAASAVSQGQHQHAQGWTLHSTSEPAASASRRLPRVCRAGSAPATRTSSHPIAGLQWPSCWWGNGGQATAPGQGHAAAHVAKGPAVNPSCAGRQRDAGCSGEDGREAALTVLEGATTLLHPLPPEGSLQEEEEEQTLQPWEAPSSFGKGTGAAARQTPPCSFALVLSELLFAFPK